MISPTFPRARSTNSFARPSVVKPSAVASPSHVADLTKRLARVIPLRTVCSKSSVTPSSSEIVSIRFRPAPRYYKGTPLETKKINVRPFRSAGPRHLIDLRRISSPSQTLTHNFNRLIWRPQFQLYVCLSFLSIRLIQFTCYKCCCPSGLKIITSGNSVNVH